MNKILIAFWLFLIDFGVGYGQHQSFYHDLRDGLNHFDVRSITVQEDHYIVGISKVGMAQLIKVAFDGRILNTYTRLNSTVHSLSKLDENHYLVVSTPFSQIHADSLVYIVLDNDLNFIRTFYPIKVNYPRPFFRNRSFMPAQIEGKPAFFGGFFDSSNVFSDTLPLHGWLSFIRNTDSLMLVKPATSFRNTRMLYCYPADTGFYSVEPASLVVYPWSPTVSVSSISKFDNQMNWQKTANFAMPSNLPGYTRLLESNGTITLATNEHSVYAMANYEAASPNFLSITQKSCAIYRFDRELNRIRVVHDTAATGKVSETSARQQIAFDQSGKYLYAVWKECDPYQFFADQTRECATIVLKYDTALNLVWKRVFGIPDMNFHAETMAPTPDGGLLVAGFYIDLPPGLNIRNTFVLKVDSAGNHVVSVPHLPAIEASVLVYPNPTSDVLHMRWENGPFSQLQIHDLQGRLIGQFAIEPQSNETQVNVHHWAPGMYFYQLRSPSGQQLLGKFLKR